MRRAGSRTGRCRRSPAARARWPAAGRADGSYATPSSAAARCGASSAGPVPIGLPATATALPSEGCFNGTILPTGITSAPPAAGHYCRRASLRCAVSPWAVYPLRPSWRQCGARSPRRCPRSHPAPSSVHWCQWAPWGAARCRGYQTGHCASPAARQASADRTLRAPAAALEPRGSWRRGQWPARCPAAGAVRAAAPRRYPAAGSGPKLEWGRTRSGVRAPAGLPLGP